VIFAGNSIDRCCFLIGLDSALTMEPHDILLVLLIVNHLGPLDNLTTRDVGPRLRREDMAHSFPRDKVAAAIAVDADETRVQSSV
jgi:hypothetical protein